MRLTRLALVVVLGLFALVAQTLLFREFLTALEGNELGVGSFFGSWLLWVAAGAVLGRLVASRLSIATAGRFELLTLLYIPIFLLQQYLIAHARQVGGVSAYEVYPFARMFAASLLVNGPISLLTGCLFTLACQWLASEHDLPVARVYILETFGSFLGGIAVTSLLVRGVSAEIIFLGAAFLLTLSVGMCLAGRSGPQRSLGALSLVLTLLIVIPVLVQSGLAGGWTQWNNRTAWLRLLPAEQYQGSFTTAHGRYLYGEREGQFLVMSGGGVCEALPNTEHASEVVALSLAQHPAAQKILVVGPGSLSICFRLLDLPQVKSVVWLHPDPEYPRALLGILPDRFRTAAQRVEVPGTDLRHFLRQNPRQYDLILLNLPDTTTLVLNRYGTQEFFWLLKTALSEGGVVGTRISGAANYLGGELVYVGASALLTLESVFEQVVLKPGDESWLMASDRPALCTAPAVLRDQFAGIEKAAAVYPPDGLLSLYVPDRMEFQLAKYRETAAGVQGEMLLNTDRRPKALLFSMLLVLRRAEFLALAGHLPVILVGGVWLAACPILVYALLRLVYLLAPRSRHDATGATPLFDGYFLILSTGLAGMSLSMVLMFVYQSHFGSLFLHIGLISSLFMFGSCLGSVVAERLLVRQSVEPWYLLPGCTSAHLLLVWLVFRLHEDAAKTVYVVLFTGCGFFVGIYFPLVAQRLRGAGHDPRTAGSSLEMLDHLGGAAGAVLTGWLLIPALGAESTLCILGLLIAVNLTPVLVRARPVQQPPAADWFDGLARPVGYVMVGVGAVAVISSNIVAAVQTGEQGQRLLAAARAMTGSAELTKQQVQLQDGSTLTYFATADSAKRDGGFVFSTAQLARGISGYGGPIVLAAYVDRDGRLRDLQVIGSHETPAYLESLESWLKQLPGQNVFPPSSLEEVDAVTGATMTTQAVLGTLEQSGHGFAVAALGKEAPSPGRTAGRWQPDRAFVCLAILMGLAVAIHHRPGTWTRRVFLLTSLVVAGLLLNVQYCSLQVVALLGLNLPGAALSGPLFLVLVVPAVVLLFGNVYCGYVCPFGALQELVGDLRPAKLATDPAKQVWRYGRAVKYALLLLLLVLFAVTRDYGVLSADPLITVFSTLRDWSVLFMGITILALSVVFRRFWCRNLCPAGAFLALLCGAKLLPKLTPPSGPARCDLGVRAASELDCICCDRCKHEKD